MRATLMLSAALTLAISSTGAFAQTSQYDRTGDHMVSYGTSTPMPAPVHVRESRHRAKLHAVSAPQVPIDRTSDHMMYYGPIAQ